MPPTRRTTTVEFVRGSVRGTRRAGAGDAAQPLHARQHVLRVLRDPGVDPRRVPAGRRPDRAVDRLRHHRRRGRPAGRRGHPVRAAVRLARRPGVLRPGPGAARLHAVLPGPRRVGPAGLGRLLPVGGLRGDPAGPVQHDRSTRPPTSGTSPACPAPGPPASSWPRCSRSATTCRAATGCGCCWSSSSPALLMVSNIRFRSFRSLVSPKSGKPYGIIAAGGRCSSSGFALVPVRHRLSCWPTATCWRRCCCRSSRRWAGCCRPGSRRPCHDGAAHPPGRRPRGRGAGPRAGRVRAGAARGPPHRGAAHRRACSATPPRCSATSPRTTDGEVVGVALWFLNFSTWRGTHGIYLEDLYVQPRAPRQRARQGAAAHAGRGLRRARLLAAGVVGAGLEHPVDRLLQGRRRRPDGRVDRLPAHRRRADRLRRPTGATPHDHRARASPSAG